MPYIGSDSAVTTSSAALTVTIPAGVQDGDVAWLLTERSTTAGEAPPAGWALREAVEASNKRRARYTKTLTAAEAGTTITTTIPVSGIKWIVQLLVFRGADPGQPEAPETPPTTIQANLTTIPAATTTTPSDLILVMGTRDTSVASITPPSGWTKAQERYAGGGGPVQAATAYRNAVAPGPVAGTWATDSGTAASGATTLVIINPAAPTAPSRYRFDGTTWRPLGRPRVITDTGAPGATWVKPLIGAGGGPPATQWDPLDAVVGPMLARRSYDGNLPSSFASSAAASDVAAGRHSYWSWKPSVTGFPSSTSQKNALAAFLATIPAGHKVTIFGHHEPENDMPQDFTIHQWGALQDAIADIVIAAGNPDVRFGPCFMGPWTWDSRSPYYEWIDQWATVMDWGKFDIVGIDPYASVHPGGISLENMLTVPNSGSGSSVAISVMAHLSQFDIPVGIVEWGYYRKQPSGHGSMDPPVDPIPDQVVADWITDAYDWFKRWNQANPPRLVGGKVRGSFIDCALWFNYSLLGADTPLTGPLSNPTTVGPKIDAYAAIVADSKIPPTTP